MYFVYSVYQTAKTGAFPRHWYTEYTEYTESYAQQNRVPHLKIVYCGLLWFAGAHALDQESPAFFLLLFHLNICS